MGEAIISRTLDNNEVEVVQETGTSISGVMSQKAVTDELNNKVDKVEGKGLSSKDFTAEDKEKLDNAVPITAVVQETGTSTTNIMSQKAVTDKLNEKMDISQEYIRRRQYVPLKSSADNTGWFLVLHGKNNLQYENYSCMLAVTQTYPATSNQSSGIIFFNIRVDDYNMFVADFRILCGNLLPDRFRLVINSYTDFYVYIKTTTDFERYMFEVLSEGRQKESTYLPTFEFNGTTTTVSDDPGGTTPKGNEQILLDLVYPVGSIYMSVSSTNPKSLFGGTWEQVKDRFLLSAGSTYSAGATGGESTHKLTTSEIPSHSHKISESTEQRWSSADGHWASFRCGTNSVIGGDIYTKNTGGGNAHNNMPPYIVVYMWKRTA